MKKRKSISFASRTQSNYTRNTKSSSAIKRVGCRYLEGVALFIAAVSFIILSGFTIWTAYWTEPQLMCVPESWLVENLFYVDTYKEGFNHWYAVSLVDIEAPGVLDFDEICDIFMSTPYSHYNSHFLSDGVNCQGMTIYLAKWCELTRTPFSVEYTPTHTSINITHEGVTYNFSFTKSPKIIQI